MTVQDSIDLTNVAPIGSSHDSLLVFFITGNPGLIEYYRTFLTLCFDSLRTKYSNHHIKVAGTSLRGFRVQDDDHQHAANDNTQGPYDLEQQIEHVGQILDRAIESLVKQGHPTKVVLMGHSVGSYILLEVLRRRKQSPTTQKLGDDARVIGGICLFPTVTHIAKSPSGKKFSVRFSYRFYTLHRNRDTLTPTLLRLQLKSSIDLCLFSSSLLFRTLLLSQASSYVYCSPGSHSDRCKLLSVLSPDSLLLLQNPQLHSSRVEAASGKHCKSWSSSYPGALSNMSQIPCWSRDEDYHSRRLGR